MSHVFQSNTSNWLQTYRAFVNQPLVYSDTACRTLGPASENMWDPYPFTKPNELVGLFAGLSVSGIPADTKYVEVTGYSSLFGFTPLASGESNSWQQMTSHDWQQLTPATESIIPVQEHDVDLTFQVVTNKGVFVFHTADWDYTANPLSPDYQQHVWRRDGVLLYGVTYLSANDSIAPFLRPNRVTITQSPARLDASCLFVSPHVSRLFNGTAVLTAGNNISITQPSPDGFDATLLNAAFLPTASVPGRNTALSMLSLETHSFIVDDIYLKEELDEKWLRTVNNQPPNFDNGVTLLSDDETGCYKFTQNYAESDIITGVTQIEPHQLIVYNSCIPCCSCDEFFTDHETLRPLAEKLEKLVTQYNDAFKKMSEEVQPVFNTYASRLLQYFRAFYASYRAGFLLAPDMLVAESHSGTRPVLEVLLRLQFRNDNSDEPRTFPESRLDLSLEKASGYLYSASIVSGGYHNELAVDSVGQLSVYLTSVTVNARETVTASLRLFLASYNYGEGAEMFNVAEELGRSILVTAYCGEEMETLTVSL
ncbi:MAG: hypothetical protein LBQ66_02300 [Planctomycetaceae bacterium]|jgi:hypothetical protein|nr:hypothetical protein [Planctomycetaceae bacterium]